MKFSLKSVIVLTLSTIFLAIWPRPALAFNTVKPQLNWQRSTEAADKVVTENVPGSKVDDALSLPLDLNQQVFDNGLSTPQINKDHVQSGVQWSSWKQYSASQGSCGPIFELRHFQTKFTLASLSGIQGIKLKSPYYQNSAFPINDNAYIYLNGHYITRLGTSYWATSLGFNGSAPYANETDGWVGNGDLGTSPAQFLQVGENVLDIVAGETCRWGGMGKLELIIEQSAPQPFLDLPWGYQSKDLSFSDAALAINSYFDHEYPLLSSGISEPSESTDTLTSFRNEFRSKLEYSSHDGYDYGKRARANLGDPVLAAAEGTATYSNSCGPCGNMILIDHGNGYQTRYLHLLDDGLITKTPGQKIAVNRGQQIGRIGYTGNVIPPGDLGAHIHFMVIQDKNNDGNFDDNIPDGITDPFGWQSDAIDPWPNFSFSYGGQPKTGDASFYLWTKAIANLSNQLSSNGGFFELERYKLNFPQGATNQNLDVQMQYAPISKPSNVLESIGSTIVVTAKDTAGNLIHSFQKFFTVSIDFSSLDLSSYDQNTLSIYSSEDGTNWVQENTTVNMNEKTASAQINHLSHFALMAERIDTVAPTTAPIFTGECSQENWFRSNVQLELNAQDNPEGLGVDYTLYKINDGWQQYFSPLTFIDEGKYKIEFFSVDKAENQEVIKSVEFNIDKTPPQAVVEANPNLLWPPNGQTVSVAVSGFAFDENQVSNTAFDVEDEYNEINPAISGFGDMIKLISSRKGQDKDGRTYTIKVRVRDLAGNESTSTTTTVVVPHDQR